MSMDLTGLLNSVLPSALGTIAASVTLSRTTAGTYTPATDARTDAVQSQTVEGVFVGPQVKRRAEGLVAVDERLLVAANQLSWAPDETTKVTVKNTVWSVTAITVTAPQGEPVLYELDLKRGG